MQSHKTQPEGQYCSIQCEQCGKKVGGYHTRYQISHCLCGTQYWALRPQRKGPLKLFPYPGDYRMKRAQESAIAYRQSAIQNM